MLTARGQFALSTTNKNYNFTDVDAWQQAWFVAGFSMAEWSLPPPWRLTLVPKADHFFANDSTQPDWAKGRPVAVIGDHAFYRAD